MKIYLILSLALVASASALETDENQPSKTVSTKNLLKPDIKTIPSLKQNSIEENSSATPLTEEGPWMFFAGLGYGPSSNENLEKQEFGVAAKIDRKAFLNSGIQPGFLLKTALGGERPGPRRVEGHLIHSHILNKDVPSGIFLYLQRDEYEHWDAPSIKTIGSDVRVGFGLPEFDKDLSLTFNFGAEIISSNTPQVPENHIIPLYKAPQQHKPVPLALNTNDEKTYNYTPQALVHNNTRSSEDIYRQMDKLVSNRVFKTGEHLWVGLNLVKDMRDNLVNPSEGYILSLKTKAAPSIINSTFGYLQLEASASIYKDLLTNKNLILGNHFKICTVQELNSKKIIPFKELFRMGGSDSIRGHGWNDIGSVWKRTYEPLGCRNAIQCNNEITFPIVRKYNLYSHLFYDLGTAWDTPDTSIKEFNNAVQESQRIKLDDVIIRNKFSLRHAAGAGLFFTGPIQIGVDWGFKLDKEPGELPYIFHINANYTW